MEKIYPTKEAADTAAGELSEKVKTNVFEVIQFEKGFRIIRIPYSTPTIFVVSKWCNGKDILKDILSE